MLIVILTENGRLLDEYIHNPIVIDDVEKEAAIWGTVQDMYRMPKESRNLVSTFASGLFSSALEKPNAKKGRANACTAKKTLC